MHNNETYLLADTFGSCHTLQVSSDLLMLDQHPVRGVRRQEGLVTFVSDDQEVACTPEDCWYAVAGAGAVPTVAEVGRLLADHLAHWNDEQRLQVLAQSLSRLIGEQTPVLLLPQPRLDPFIEAALARCEPTPTLAKVEALAQVIDQPPALVVAWLQLRGKTVLLPDETPKAEGSEDRQAPETRAGKRKAAAAKASRVMFRWTGEMIRQLAAAFLATPLDQSISAAAKAIAEHHSWPAESVEYKIYHLDLPSQRLAQQSALPSLKERSEQDEPAALGEGTDPPSELDETRHEVKAPRTPHLTEPESASPVEMSRGNFVWDVRVDGAVQRWYLDYPYGAFPVQDGLVVYQGATYALHMVGINTVRATSIQQQTHEETPPPEVLNVG